MDRDTLANQETELARREAGGIGGDAGRPRGEDPAEAAVHEAGGGVAEGFEEAEDALIDHAQHGDLGHSPRRDGFTPEVESDRTDADYGQADEEQVSERLDP